MAYVIGFIVWIVLGIAAGLATLIFFRGPTTTGFLSLFFGVCGALVGGMLGVAFYIAHDPSPLRVGGIIGAVLGSVLFAWTYHMVGRKLI